MTGRGRTTLRLISRLLAYPDEELVAGTSELESILATIEDPESRAALSGFGQRLRTEPLPALQAEYVAAFDLDSATCLEMSYHRYGDGRERSAALARLAGLYRQAGYEPERRELPDFLPMLLEFASVCPDRDLQGLGEEYGQAMAALAGRLKEALPAHAALVAAAVAALGR